MEYNLDNMGTLADSVNGVRPGKWTVMFVSTLWGTAAILTLQLLRIRAIVLKVNLIPSEVI